ncbi:MAG: acetylglutamate kinase [Verrucomicrobiia bacterium]
MAGSSSSITNALRAEVLSEALPYIQRFRSQIFVIKFGGSAMEDHSLVDSLLRDVVFLEAVGINPVLVHGGGKAISEAMLKAGLETRFIGGLRVTDEASIALVQSVLDHDINPTIVGTINRYGGSAVGLSGRDALIGRKQQPVKAADGTLVDLGRVGEVISVDTEPLSAIIQREQVPVVSPVARDERGESLNINADLAASAIAVALRASKLIYLSDVLGICLDPSDPKTLLPTVNSAQRNELIAQGVISGGMLPKVTSAVEALVAGVSKIHLIDGRIPHALLLEIFSDEGIGTEIVL